MVVKKTKIKKNGFILEITPEVASILGVNKQDDIHIIVQDNEVILKPKKVNAQYIKKQKEENDKLTKKLIEKFSPVLKKLAKT